MASLEREGAVLIPEDLLMRVADVLRRSGCSDAEELIRRLEKTICFDNEALSYVDRAIALSTRQTISYAVIHQPGALPYIQDRITRDLGCALVQQSGNVRSALGEEPARPPFSVEYGEPIRNANNPDWTVGASLRLAPWLEAEMNLRASPRPASLNRRIPPPRLFDYDHD